MRLTVSPKPGSLFLYGNDCQASSNSKSDEVKLSMMIPIHNLLSHIRWDTDFAQAQQA